MNLTKTLRTSETCSSISIPYFDGTAIHHSKQQSCAKTACSFYCGGDLYHTAVNVTFSLSVGQSVLLAASMQFFQIFLSLNSVFVEEAWRDCQQILLLYREPDRETIVKFQSPHSLPPPKKMSTTQWGFSINFTQAENHYTVWKICILEYLAIYPLKLDLCNFEMNWRKVQFF